MPVVFEYANDFAEMAKAVMKVAQATLQEPNSVLLRLVCKKIFCSSVYFKSFSLFYIFAGL